MNNIGYVSNNDNITKIREDFSELYEKYAEKIPGIKAKIANVMKIDYVTLYRRLNDSLNLYQLFTRDEIIMMALMFNLDKFQTNDFLSSYYKSELDDGEKRDHIILKGIECNYDIDKINETLVENKINELEVRKKNKFTF